MASLGGGRGAGLLYNMAAVTTAAAWGRSTRLFVGRRRRGGARGFRRIKILKKAGVGGGDGPEVGGARVSLFLF